jgi:hypothetical protein
MAEMAGKELYDHQRNIHPEADCHRPSDCAENQISAVGLFHNCLRSVRKRPSAPTIFSLPQPDKLLSKRRCRAAMFLTFIAG